MRRDRRSGRRDEIDDAVEPDALFQIREHERLAAGHSSCVTVRRNCDELPRPGVPAFLTWLLGELIVY